MISEVFRGAMGHGPSWAKKIFAIGKNRKT